MSLSHKRCGVWAPRRRLRSWFVPQNFLFPQRDQPLLMPVDMREWLPEDDLVFVVLDAVATLSGSPVACVTCGDAYVEDVGPALDRSDGPARRPREAGSLANSAGERRCHVGSATTGAQPLAARPRRRARRWRGCRRLEAPTRRRARRPGTGRR